MRRHPPNRRGVSRARNNGGPRAAAGSERDQCGNGDGDHHVGPNADDDAIDDGDVIDDADNDGDGVVDADVDAHAVVDAEHHGIAIRDAYPDGVADWVADEHDVAVHDADEHAVAVCNAVVDEVDDCGAHDVAHGNSLAAPAARTRVTLQGGSFRLSVACAFLAISTCQSESVPPARRLRRVL